MPQRDTIHPIIKRALLKDGWQITDDPYIISYGERFLFVDLGAMAANVVEPNIGQFIGAERQGKRIAVEIKEFQGKSAIGDLEQAIGQYALYRLLLQQIDPERDLYLAITDITYQGIFSEPIGELVIAGLPLCLLVVNMLKIEVQQWIPVPNTERSSSA